MTTTDVYNTAPGHYCSKEDCENDTCIYTLNTRYKNFKQRLWTAGDVEQFDEHRDMTTSLADYTEEMYTRDCCNNVYNHIPIYIHPKNTNLTPSCVKNTFNYIFNKIKKGIYVKIVNSKLTVFLPFSKHGFINEWSHMIKFNGSMLSFIESINKLENRPFNPKSINSNIDEWIGNNSLLRYEYPPKETDANASTLKHMLETVCEQRNVPDVEFFLNRRDYPILTRGNFEPYNHIWDSREKPLVSHSYDSYTPILSMCSSDRYADLMIPTHEDWSRVEYTEGLYLPKNTCNYSSDFNTIWNNKIGTCIFRGSSTGTNVTIETNMRLKACALSHSKNRDPNDNLLYLDAGITKWNLRPRKIENSKYVKTISADTVRLFPLVKTLTYVEQSNYKYILNIDGHVSAFRLSMEMHMGSVILIVDSEWKLWFQSLLEPYIHYIPIKSDLSDLFEIIKWCKNNDDKCQQIAENARKFAVKYLNKEAILDYMQRLLVEIAHTRGNYKYNKIMLRDAVISLERPMIYYTDVYKEIKYLPLYDRNYHYLLGLSDVFKYSGPISKYGTLVREIFNNKLSTVNLYQLGSIYVCIKQTGDTKKKTEHQHEAYIGKNSINSLLMYTPNFLYTFGLESDKSVVSEYIDGISLFNYITTKEFTLDVYTSIIKQLCLALEVAQDLIAFVHYDLTPWNILVVKSQEPRIITYKTHGASNTENIRTDIVPIIIDYGKSHVIVDNIHHGYVSVLTHSRMRDIVTFIITSASYIISAIKLGNIHRFLSIVNCVIPKCDKVSNIHELKTYLKKHKKYSDLISRNLDNLPISRPYELYTLLGKSSEKSECLLDKSDSVLIKNCAFSANKEYILDCYINAFETCIDKRVFTKLISDFKHFTIKYGKSMNNDTIREYIKYIDNKTLIIILIILCIIIGFCLSIFMIKFKK